MRQISHNDFMRFGDRYATKKPKLLIIGHGRHGKDTASEMITKNFNLSFASSSRFISELLMFDLLKDKYGYKTSEECYVDRFNCRAEWFTAISNYNRPDAARLGKEIFREHDIYCGLRDKREFHAMRNTGVFDYCIWVDRSDHLPKENQDSMTLEPWMADFVIDNNGSLEELEFNTTALVKHIMTLVL